MRANLVQAFRGSVAGAFLAVVLAAGLVPFTAVAVLASEPPQARTAQARTAQARAAQAPVDLGTAADFSVLAGQEVTNTGPTVVNMDLGLSPGSMVSGFPPGTVLGTTHVADGTAATAQTDLTTAYNDAAGRTPATPVSGDIGGQTLMPGVYNSASTLGITGTLTLDGQGDPNAVFIFQVGLRAHHRLVQRGEPHQRRPSLQRLLAGDQLRDAGYGSTFRGTILALTSITVNTNVQLFGRALARNAAVTLDSDNVTTTLCEPVPIQLPGVCRRSRVDRPRRTPAAPTAAPDIAVAGLRRAAGDLHTWFQQLRRELGSGAVRGTLTLF